jgi:hypothetical protein
MEPWRALWTLTLEASLKMEPWRLKMEPWWLKMEPWRVFRPVVADLHRFDEEQDPDLDLNLDLRHCPGFAACPRFVVRSTLNLLRYTFCFPILSSIISHKS